MNGDANAGLAIATSGLDHIALRCGNLARSRRFYVELLGFPLVAENEHAFIVRIGESLVGCVAPDAATPSDDRFDPRRVGLDHVALRCDDEAELHRVAEALSEAGIEHSAVQTNPVRGNKYVAFKDPDRIAWQLAMR